MYKALRPLLFTLDPEFAHNVASLVGRAVQAIPYVGSAVKSVYSYDNPRLNINVFGKDFKNPVGLAAGFDKNAQLIDFFFYIGFGYVEVGSATAEPVKKTQKRKIFRLTDDNALINRMGLNNIGCQLIATNIERSRRYMPIGVNIAKTPGNDILGDKAIEDILFSYNVFSQSADYVTLNLSCPNTSDGKTFEDPLGLDILLSEIRKRKISRNFNTPLLVKLSPDIKVPALEAIVDVCHRHDIDGYVIANTSTERTELSADPHSSEMIGGGGLSGRPLRRRSTQMVRLVHHMIKGRVPIIGVGGVDSAESAYEKIKAGASLIQLYTGLVYEGPSVAKKINKGLVRLLESDGFDRLSEAVGVESRG